MNIVKCIQRHVSLTVLLIKFCLKNSLTARKKKNKMKGKYIFFHTLNWSKMRIRVRKHFVNKFRSQRFCLSFWAISNSNLRCRCYVASNNRAKYNVQNIAFCHLIPVIMESKSKTSEKSLVVVALCGDSIKNKQKEKRQTDDWQQYLGFLLYSHDLSNKLFQNVAMSMFSIDLRCGHTWRLVSKTGQVTLEDTVSTTDHTVDF